MPTEDRRRGKQLPNPVVPPDTVCFSIQIPSAVQYRAALLGQLNILGDWHTWDHPIDGTVCEDCEEAAQLWRNAIGTATFSDECGGVPVSCEDIADCIETSQAVQDAIAEQIANNSSNTTNIYNTSTQGVPLSSSQRNEPIAISDDCGEDSLFGSVSYLVEQLDKNNRDFLEIVEVGTNTRERVSQVLAAIPLLETLPVNEMIDFADKLQSEILENYEAQWTTAVYDTYRCELFCIALAKPDCEMTFDDVFNYFEQRVGASLDPSNFLEALATYVAFGTWAGTTVIDIMMVVQLGILREASNWIGISLRTLQAIALLGKNNPDGDWEILPCGCGDETDCLSFGAASQGWLPFPGGYGLRDSSGWKGEYYAPTDKYYFYIYLPATTQTGTFDSVTIKFNQPWSDFEFINGEGYMYKNEGPAVTQFTATELTKQTGVTFPFSNSTTWSLRPLNGDRTVSGTLRITEICFSEV